MTTGVVLGALAFIFIAVLGWALCRSAAFGDSDPADWDELEPRRRAKQNGIRNIERAS